jgi:6-pyruvoyltetrahydropterin/6-carboxytetrahydropterin synthase
MSNFSSTKYFSGFPCTHRQWKADSHCRFVHGYSRSFHFEFKAKSLTKEGWVVDFGGLKKVKAWLDNMFDHTFLASKDDPYLEKFKQLDKEGVIQLRIYENVGMEGSAIFVYEKVNEMLKELTEDRAWVHKVEVRENEKNSAIYIAE